MAASVPNSPSNIKTTDSNGYIIVSWNAPFDGGSLITAYTIQI
jgi:hypothetical protein